MQLHYTLSRSAPTTVFVSQIWPESGRLTGSLAISLVPVYRRHITGMDVGIGIARYWLQADSGFQQIYWMFSWMMDGQQGGPFEALRIPTEVL